ncbi:MAG: hypothetical protein ABIH28_00015 [archaeon]
MKKKKDSKDSKNSFGIMGVHRAPNAQELKRWTSDIKAEKIDVVLEYLHCKKCLNKKGEKLAKQFWEEFIKNENKK